MNVNDKLYITQKSNNINLFIYTNITQESQIDVQVNNVQVNTFALFGFGITTQIVIDSNINISLQFQVLTGALLCIHCDIEVQSCSLVLIASGQQISGLIIEPRQSVIVQQSFIQYRISSMNSSGLINVNKQLSMILIVCQCQLTGSNLIQNANNGYIASTMYVDIILNITKFDICVDQTQRFGQQSVKINIIGTESFKCDICNEQFVIYGLCGDILQYSEIINGMYQCVYPFEYLDNKCICTHGYLLNVTQCINIVESINNMNNLVNSNISDQTLLLAQKIEKIGNSLIVIDQNILSNISEIENRIMSNLSKSDYNLLMNTSILDNRIFSNITDIKKDIIIAQIITENNLQYNTTVLDWRIFNNISYLNTNIQNFTLQLQDVNNSLLLKTEIFEQQLQLQNQIIEQLKIQVNNLTQQLNCTSNYGYSIINGSCVQVTCVISGQQSINGICQCTNINSIVLSGSCVCPANSNVIGTACVCTISGQIMQNGQCVCSTNGAFVDNNVCICGLNSINISNSCSCPIGASLVNRVCTCTNINAYISENLCVCPTYSSLVGNVCMCPSNSQIVNNQCSCNLITGQILNNSVCQCQTTGAFVNNGTCICGLYALNTSNICMCPTNSSMINNICTCDKIIGQLMIGGSCQCPSGQIVVNNSCQQNSYVINFINFECSQEIFTQNFNINSITNQISSLINFSSGYVFSISTVIQNAFIDISDNVYSTVVYPLFQSQSTFSNLKIEFGTQSLNNGSLIIASTSSITINNLNIISKPGCQLQVNNANTLNILTSLSISTSVTNLLVNISFASSNGNITLINNISGIFNISRYQILGSFESTSTVSMIGINVNAVKISVNLVSFQPNVFNVGNGSSYLFGSVLSTATNFVINNLTVIIGSSSNFLILSSKSSSNYDLFGGIIAYSASSVSVNNVLLDSYQKFYANYGNSGVLIGYIKSTISNIVINNICLQQNIISTGKFDRFALIGWNYGNTFINSASVTLSVYGLNIWGLGLLGVLEESIYAEVINLRAFVSVNSTSGAYVGSVIGLSAAKNCSISNTSIVDGNISLGSTQCVGGFFGDLHQSTNTSIINSSIINTNISGLDQVGGIVGTCLSAKLYLKNTQIQLMRLSGSHVGVVVGYNNGCTYLFTSSSSSSNYVNGNLQNNCGNLGNFYSISGC
ncbi:Conserved_hypothetical protein [Hexamita inflata]|uniref:Uncharacterized protein n=1 Tax=Hexamita inflata TaxID=28002 RepID=A0AA86VP84_9EUKA|nr:Conserved hypothetical protein [Hexamita inflata]CAI9972148.1 Conserved hypothetical protein [Hexamita inflata]